MKNRILGIIIGFIIVFLFRSLLFISQNAFMIGLILFCLFFDKIAYMIHKYIYKDIA